VVVEKACDKCQQCQTSGILVKRSVMALLHGGVILAKEGYQMLREGLKKGRI
jgi:hypothetical protein